MNSEDLGNTFLKIAEFAKLVGMSVVALRHYDKTEVFTPAMRGVEFKNKYRLYSPTQITTVKMIRVLTEIGVDLKTIRELAKDRAPEKIIKLLTLNKDKVVDEIRFLNDVFTVISTFTELLNEGMSVTETEITVSEMPEKRIILGEANDFRGSVGFYREFIRFYTEPHEPKLNISYPVGGYWDSMDAFLDEPSLPMRFFSLDPKGNDRRGAGLYLNGYTRGYYGETNDLPERMAAFAHKNGLIFTGPVYNTYLFDELSTPDPEQYLLQVSAAVTETRRVLSRRPRSRL
jgi:DNA-binding transcriptional MerR regulator/effector-binding domain-containing protein